MRRLQECEFERAAAVFATGFMDDPAFSLVLQGFEDGKSRLKNYFLNYMNVCKELLLYKFSDTEEGYLCLYRYDTAFADFEVPTPLEELEQFQCLDEVAKEPYAVLDIMAVAPESRGKGLGGRMIDFFVNYCKEQKLCPMVEVFTDAHLPLYRAHGFEVTFSRVRQGITIYVLEYKE